VARPSRRLLMATPKKKGSGIKINPANKGKYTARAKSNGRTVQQQAAADLKNPNVSPTIKKRANFARNAKKWS
jgi:hypothetical protein